MSLLLTSVSIASSSFSCATAVQKKKKAIVIGVDGIQYEHLLKATTPTIDKLNILQGVTGGDKGGASEQATKSGPSWATVLTGVWANKHKIFANGDRGASPAHPTIFKVLADEGHKVAALANWPNILRDYFAHDLPLMEYCYYSDVKHKTPADTQTQDAILSYMFGRTQGKHNQDFTFIHLDHPDAVGDDVGFGEEYTSSLQIADQHLARVLEAIEARANENWLIIVVTDHGRSPNDGGKSHGEQTEQERTVWIASNKKIHTPEQAILGTASLADIAPTIYDFFGVEDGQLDLDGLSLLDGED